MWLAAFLQLHQGRRGQNVVPVRPSRPLRSLAMQRLAYLISFSSRLGFGTRMLDPEVEWMGRGVEASEVERAMRRQGLACLLACLLGCKRNPSHDKLTHSICKFSWHCSCFIRKCLKFGLLAVQKGEATTAYQTCLLGSIRARQELGRQEKVEQHILVVQAFIHAIPICASNSSRGAIDLSTSSKACTRLCLSIFLVRQ